MKHLNFKFKDTGCPLEILGELFHIIEEQWKSSENSGKAQRTLRDVRTFEE